MLQTQAAVAGLTKDHLRQFAPLRDHANSAAIIINGRLFGAGEVCYRRLVAPHNAEDNRFHGHLEFEIIGNLPMDTADLTVLPGVTVPALVESGESDEFAPLAEEGSDDGDAD